MIIILLILFLFVEYSNSQTLGAQERKSFPQRPVMKREYQLVHTYIDYLMLHVHTMSVVY